MLRGLRILGIIVFALLVTFSANTLKSMHESGALMDRYNHGRKANITLLAISVLAVGTLGWFELLSMRRRLIRRAYGERRYTDKREGEQVEGLDSTSIYASPETRDEWKVRRSSKSRQHRPRMADLKDQASFWMGLTRLCCVIMPILYLSLMGVRLINMDPTQEAAWLIPTGLGVLGAFSLIVAIGVFGLKTWGLSVGYVLAICNLVIFPYGTALGLFLLIGLVGSSSEFVLSQREKRRSKRGKPEKRISVPAF